MSEHTEGRELTPAQLAATAAITNAAAMIFVRRYEDDLSPGARDKLLQKCTHEACMLWLSAVDEVVEHDLARISP